MPLDALTSAEISLPATPDATQVRERIAVLSRHVDLVGLTDNHAGKPRMSPLAAVALAREVAAGADFVQTQMVFDPAGLAAFLEQAAEGGKLGDCRVHASVPVIRTARMVEILNQTLPSELPEKAAAQIAAGGGIDLAIETAMVLAGLDRVHALHL